MKGTRLALLAAASLTALAGPPFQTDDPEPIDYKNYEFYTLLRMAQKSKPTR
jgi:hypothetical protein